MTEPEGDRPLVDLPAVVVLRAQNDLDFGVRLLNQDTRAAALSDPALGLTEEEQSRLFSTLDDIANLSFAQAIEQLRDAGVNCLG
jgi:hypothetical protein